MPLPLVTATRSASIALLSATSSLRASALFSQTSPSAANTPGFSGNRSAARPSVDDGQIRPAGVSISRGQRHEPVRALAIERGDRLELIDRVAMPPDDAVGRGKRLARRRERRRQADGLLERSNGFAMFPVRFVTESKQVVCLGEPVVDGERLARRLDRVAGMAGAIVGEGQLVQHLRRAIVDLHVRGVALGRAIVPLQRREDVAELLERPRRGRVEAVRRAQIAKRRSQVALVPVGFAPFEIRQHRIGAEGDRAAERLDGEAGLAGRQRRLAGGNQPLILAVARCRLVGDPRGNAGKEDEHGGKHRPSHGALS